LEFELRLQQYIELIRAKTHPKLLEAIAHAKKYLIPFRATHPHEVQQACGLLAIPPNSPAAATYMEMYKPSRWTELADLFTTTHNTLLSLPSVPLLHIALTSGLSALKTPACHAKHLDATASNLGHGVCPICSVELNELAKNVPYAHHTKSHVDHDLLLLPNGRVYGKKRLEEQSKKTGLKPGFVRDYLTEQIYPMDQLTKVYIT
jgi:macrophage erythroblast attacher